MDKRIVIGTLKEKTTHAFLKNHYGEKKEQEIRLGKYQVDIFKDNRVIEIQTHQFFRLKEKLQFLLQYYSVTIVHPIIREKMIRKDDSFRRSPKKGSIFEVFKELYQIKSFLTNPNLHIKIVMLDVIEYQVLRKNKYRRFDIVPVSIVEEKEFSNICDYSSILKELTFSSKSLSKSERISLSTAQIALNVLYGLGVVERIGKIGNMYIYKVGDNRV